jgi:hypothetical protein
MDAQEITLHIAVNMGRLGRWALEGKEARLKQFLAETEDYLKQLEDAPKKDKFLKTFESFKNKFNLLKSDVRCDETWAENALTWASILTHRAKLA